MIEGTKRNIISQVCLDVLEKAYESIKLCRQYFARLGYAALLTASVTGGLGLWSGSNAMAEASPPNIVFILVDDLGWTDINCSKNGSTSAETFDSTYYETPNIDQLRAGGVRFTNAYAACPSCTPSRASIITGQYPSRIDMTGLAGYHSNDGIFFHHDLPPEEDTVAEAIKSDPEISYKSCFLGKWHLTTCTDPGYYNNHPEFRFSSYPSCYAYYPDSQTNGFDYSPGFIWSATSLRSNNYWEGEGGTTFYDKCMPGLAGKYDNDTLWGNPSDANSYDYLDNYLDNSPYNFTGGVKILDLSGKEDHEYLTDSLTVKSLEFIDKMNQANQPFLLYLSHAAVHEPMEAHEEYIDYFDRGLVGHWKMDQIDVAPATLLDFSGNHRHGSFAGTKGNYSLYGGNWKTNHKKPGMVEDAFKFFPCVTYGDSCQGFFSVPDSITRNFGPETDCVTPYTDDTALDFGADDSFSISCWFKTNMTGTGPSSYGRMVYKYDGTAGAGYAIQIYQEKVQFVTWANGGVSCRATYASSCADNTWHHAVGVRDRNMGKLYLYIDGDEQGRVEIDEAAGRDLSGSIPLGIGGRMEYNASDKLVGATNRRFVGELDDVRIYKKILDTDAIGRLKYLSDPTIYHSNKIYAGMIKSLDDSVGAIMHKLDDLGIEDNTVIIFTSDNGGWEQFGITDDAPLRQGKGTPYEGGLRIPLIVKWPGHASPDTVCDVPVVSPDIFPTMLDIAGVLDGYDTFKLDGVSIVPLIEDPNAGVNRANGPGEGDDGAVFFVNADCGQIFAVRQDDEYGKWKLIKTYVGQTVNRYGYFIPNTNIYDMETLQIKYDATGALYQLYELGSDPSEDVDLLAEYPGAYESKRGHLDDLLIGWLARVDARLPQIRAYNYSDNKGYNNVWKAIFDATEGDEIILSRGTHCCAKPQSSRKNGVQFRKNGVKIRSINPNDPEIVGDTVLSFVKWPDVKYAAVRFDSGVSGCELSGITITDGPAGGIDGHGATGNTISKCIIQRNHSTLDGDHEHNDGHGAGIRDFHGIISNCIIRENYAAGGGGGLYNCNGEIKNCIIALNQALDGNGGGLYDCNATIQNCTIVGNKTTKYGGGLYGCDKKTIIISCIIWQNTPSQIVKCNQPAYSCIQNWAGDNDSNSSNGPEFANMYKFSDITVASANPDSNGVSSTEFLFNRIIVADASKYNVGDVVEYNDDGVARIVTAIDIHNNIVKFKPPISPETEKNRNVYNWGPSHTDVTEDYRPESGSSYTFGRIYP